VPAAPPSDQSGAGLVPRECTLIVDCLDQSCAGQIQDYDSFHPYLPGTTSRTGYNFLYEPLYFYNAYSESGDNIIPWIATGHQYNEDFTEVTVQIRPGVEWSDGQPWTARDLVFTIEMLRANAPELTFSVDMEKWVKEAVVVDDLTARIVLSAPNPRFIFSYFTHNFDNGVPIVPEHIWKEQDPKTFKNLDMVQGLPVFSGPYRLVLSSPDQRVWDLRWRQSLENRNFLDRLYQGLAAFRRHQRSSFTFSGRARRKDQRRGRNHRNLSLHSHRASKCTRASVRG
jgi:peptide/nickel transport system substrate-binding protein